MTVYTQSCPRCNGAVELRTDDFGKPELVCVNCARQVRARPDQPEQARGPCPGVGTFPVEGTRKVGVNRIARAWCSYCYRAIRLSKDVTVSHSLPANPDNHRAKYESFLAGTYVEPKRG